MSFSRRSGRVANAAYTTNQGQYSGGYVGYNQSTNNQSQSSPGKQQYTQLQQQPQQSQNGQKQINQKTISLLEEEQFQQNQEHISEMQEKLLESLEIQDGQGEAEGGDDVTMGPDWKKKKPKMKTPLAIRRRRLNNRLSKLLTPKSALMIVHEFKPGCVYKVAEMLNSNPKVFVAQVEHENKQLATGQGHSKQMAKNNAAENAIKAIVSELMAAKKVPTPGGEAAEGAEPKAEQAEGEQPMETTSLDEDPCKELPWAGLASFAMYKLFNEWHNQGAEVPISPGLKGPAAPKKKKPAQATRKTELPANPLERHPTLLLNTMIPGCVAVELERTPPPNSTVTVGYDIEGSMYTGSSRNRKDARKAAAKAVLQALYGLTYPAE